MEIDTRLAMGKAENRRQLARPLANILTISDIRNEYFLILIFSFGKLFLILRPLIRNQSTIMLEPIKIESTAETPYVELDKEQGIFKFEGKSLPEDVIKFYGPIQNWFSEYCANPNPETEINFNLEYFNSSTARIIVKMLIGVESLVASGKYKVHISWQYKENDEVMLDRGMELKSVLNIPFDMIEVSC